MGGELAKIDTLPQLFVISSLQQNMIKHEWHTWSHLELGKQLTLAFLSNFHS